MLQIKVTSCTVGNDTTAKSAQFNGEFSHERDVHWSPAGLLNAGTSFLLPRDHVYAGTFPNGSWAGCLGMISRNEADLAIGPILPTIARFGVAEPLPQYYFIRLTTCAGTRRLFKTDVFGYVTALDPQARGFLDGDSQNLFAARV
ncbi:hypothetical protein MTO96_028008 [Rhipicephalus appendiculatus]